MLGQSVCASNWKSNSSTPPFWFCVSYKKPCNATILSSDLWVRSDRRLSLIHFRKENLHLLALGPLLACFAHERAGRHCEMRMEGLIPFVYGAIKKRRATRRTMHYDLMSSPGGSPPQTRERPPAEQRYAGGAHRPQSQSCRFVVPRSLADELHLLRDDGDGEEPTASDWRGGLSRSRRFSSMRVFGCVSGVHVHEPVVI